MQRLAAISCFAMVLIILCLIFGCGKDNTATGPAMAHDTIPPADIIDLDVVGFADSTCLLSWTAPGDDGSIGRAASYDIRYAVDSHRVRNWADAHRVAAPPVPDTAMKVQQFLVTGLNVDSTYYFAVKTIDDANNASSMSNIAYEPTTTIPEIWLTSPADSSKVADVVDLSAFADDDKGIVRVEFYVDTVLVATDVTPPYSAAWDAFSKPHGSTHIIFARAVDTDSNVVGSNPVTCTIDTVLAYPPAPVLSPAYDITDRSAKLSWTASVANDLAGYVIECDTSQTDSLFWKQIATASATAVGHKVAGLEDNWLYQVRVIAVDRFGHRTISNDISFPTQNVPPAWAPFEPPKRLADFGIILQWTKSKDYDFVSYILYRSDDKVISEDDERIALITQRDSTKLYYLPPDSIQGFYYGIYVEDNTGSRSICYLSEELSARPIPSIIYPETSIDSNNVRAVWSRSNDRYFGDYYIDIDTSASLVSPRIIGKFSMATDTTGIISNLLDNCQYYYRVRITTTDSFTAVSDVKSMHTINASPPPATLFIAQTESGAPLLRWERPQIADFAVYHVYRSTDSVVTADDELLAMIFRHDSLAFIDNTAPGDGLLYYAILTTDTEGLSTFSDATLWNRGRFALHFDGSQYCVVPSYSDLNVTTGFTIEAWVFPQSYGQFTRIVDKTETVCCFQYNLSLNDGMVWIDIGRQTVIYSRKGGNAQIPLNSWSHIAVTYSSGTICFYINGILDKTVSSGSPFATALSELNFGRREMFDEFYFHGAIDEIRIWNYARSQAEVSQNCNKVLTGFESGLIGYWNLDEGTGDVIHGITGGNGYLGSAVGADSKDATWIISTAPILY